MKILLTQPQDLQSQGRNTQLTSPRRSDSDRGDPEIKQSHIKHKHGLPRSLCELAMTCVAKMTGMWSISNANAKLILGI